MLLKRRIVKLSNFRVSVFKFRLRFGDAKFSSLGVDIVLFLVVFRKKLFFFHFESNMGSKVFHISHA